MTVHSGGAKWRARRRGAAAAGGSYAAGVAGVAETLAASGPAVPQYHDRVPGTVEPIHAYDGGVRYAASLLLVEPAYGYGGGAPAAAAALTAGAGAGAALRDAAEVFAAEDLPRPLQVVRPDTLVLLPQPFHDAVAAALRARGDAGGAASPLLDRLAVQEGGGSVLHYAAHAYVMSCDCSAARGA